MADEIVAWLLGLGLGKYVELFVENDIDLEALPYITDKDLIELGVAVGARRKIIASIERLQQTGLQERGATVARGDGMTAGARSDTAERRHLTVLFCDLVGSTALSGRFDPEELRETITAYQNAVAGAVARFDGYVAKFMGDGVLCYFGWPRAHEDDAERAIRAGLSVLQLVRNMSTSDGTPLAARIGVATGLVVVGDLIGEGAAQERAVIGETPNIAARLQGIAEPDEMVLADSTRRLLGDLFELKRLGSRSLKGVDHAVEAFAVRGERLVESRFAARLTGGMTELIGRDRELALLLDRWGLAKSGEGQMVLLTGEAGIGKSRIAQGLVDAVADENLFRIGYQCSPYHTESAFFPSAQQLSLAAGFTARDTEDEKLDKLAILLRMAHEDLSSTLPLLASLVGLGEPAEARFGALSLTPQRQRELTLNALLDQLTGLAAKKPVLFTVEDAHWIDPSTLELVERCLDRIGNARVMMLVTTRPTFVDGFGSHPIVTRLTLNRLGREQVGDIVRRITKGKALPEELRSEIAVRTDGVPLFVEELTKSILESGALRETEETWVLDRPLDMAAIPASLHDSLLARLDRLKPVKEIAQLAACIGREFSYQLLSEVSSLGKSDLQDALDRLMGAELIFRRGTPPEATYTFKHALVRDAAYQSLLIRDRRRIHARIARAISERFPGIATSQPVLLAQHYTEAGMAHEAADCWRRAGELALQRSANLEAAASLELGISQLLSLPETPDRARQEFAMQVALGSAYSATRGIVSPEVERAFGRARDLAPNVEDGRERFNAVWGYYFVFEIRGNWPAALRNIPELERLAARENDPGLILQANHAAWTANTMAGNLPAALLHSHAGRDLYDPEAHGHHKFRYGGHDPFVCCHMMGAFAHLLSGEIRKGRASIERALALAGEIGHPMTQMVATWFHAIFDIVLGEFQLGREMAERTASLGREYNNAPLIKVGEILAGYADVTLDPDADRKRIADVLAPARKHERTGLLQSFYLGLLSDAHIRAGEWNKGRAALADAFRMVKLQGEHVWEPELHRLQGDFALAASGSSFDDADVCYRKAISIARAQQSRLLELRAATCLARLLGEANRRREGASLIAASLEKLDCEGNEADVLVARALLDQLL